MLKEKTTKQDRKHAAGRTPSTALLREQKTTPRKTAYYGEAKKKNVTEYSVHLADCKNSPPKSKLKNVAAHKKKS
jgi:hypothetical protein